jgi:hypothetical protein
MEYAYQICNLERKNMYAIVILNDGWVFVGDIVGTAEELVMTNVRNIRRWGTTGGLGELVKNGPTASTVLDDYGPMWMFRMSQVVGYAATDASLWGRTDG